MLICCYTKVVTTCKIDVLDIKGCNFQIGAEVTGWLVTLATTSLPFSVDFDGTNYSKYG